jgi:hypothetical protein
VGWEVEVTDQFREWWDSLDETEQEDVDSYVRNLEERGPTLPFPYSSDVKESKHGQMRELRPQSNGKPLRVFYAFDPRRAAILLIGGDKTGNNRFYEIFVPIADHLYDEHLVEIQREQKHGRPSPILRTSGKDVSSRPKARSRKS